MSMPTAASLLNMYHCTSQLKYVNQLALMIHTSVLQRRQFAIAQLGSKEGVPRRIRDVSFGKLSFNKRPETGIQRCCVFPRSVAAASMVSHMNFSTNDTLNKYETIMSLFQSFVFGIGNASSLPFLLAILVFLISSIYLTDRLSKSESLCISSVDKGLLILSPTAFNRSVIARCPSILLETSGDANGDVFNKVGLQCHQIVSIPNAFVVGKSKASISNEDGSKLTYQRLCIDAEDEGVLALDWPSHLDIRGEHGLDTTLLLIPGDAKGSKDPVILEFVEVALQSGYFPIVMNPRGCAGSPVTTPRLFSAQDSDDVRAAVSFLARVRPWAAIMGAGWDFGANSLTKYLGEEKDATPLTAAVCVNNPFDLDAFTKSLKYVNGGTLDRELTKGLVEILRTNEALFRGRKNKKCQISEGLTASSMRDFDIFISAPTHGYESLQEFYASASCGNFIQDVKVPLLCIQDHTMCSISTVPQHIFEGSLYTTLIFSPFGGQEAYGKQSQIYKKKMMQDTFNHQLTLEWLTAVELAFLKGRRTTLDTESKPSKSWDSLRTGVQSVEILERHLDSIPYDSRHCQISGLPVPINDVSFAETSGLKPEELKSEEENKKDEQTAVEDMQKGEAHQAAESILNVLEVMMPGSFSNPMKQQVLGAVERGETVVNALESAVPADVRDKLLTAVSGAAQARGINFDIVGFNSSIPPPRLPPGMLESIQEKLSVITGKGRQNDFAATIFHVEKGKTNTTADNSDAHEKASKVAANEHDKQDSRSEADYGNAKLAPDTDNSEAEARVENPDLANSDFQKEDAFQSGYSEKDKGIYSAEETNLNMLEFDTKMEVESLIAGRETKKTNGIAKSVSPAPKFPAPIDVGQAIEALTGLDDSTQMAVTNIFGVIEGMLEKIENESHKRDGKSGHEHSSEGPSFDNNARSLEAKEAVILSTDHSDTQHNQASSPNNNQQRPDVEEINEKLKATCLRGFILDLQGKVHTNNTSKRVAAGRSGIPCNKYMMYQDTAAKNESSENLYLVSIMEPEETCKLLSVFCQGNKDKKIAKMYKGLSYVELASTGLLELPIEDRIAAAVHKLVLRAVEMEVERRLQSELLKDFRHALNEDLLRVANSVAKAAWKSMLVPQVVQVSAKSQSQGPICRQILGAEAIAQAVASVYSDTVVLQQVLPFGILVGVILVALATSFQAVIASQSVGKFRPDAERPALREGRSKGNEDDNNDHFSNENHRSSVTGSICKGGAFQGAVASAISASAVYAEHKTNENCPSDSLSSKNMAQHRMDIDGAEGIVRENQSMMTNIERAISVASPVVPTKDGEVDHEKLVAALAGLGQKFGFLRFVGKAALLWGGLRGAMSLTEKLILFLRISERPLLQRILGFAAMVMLLWTPVIVPLLPNLLNQYASHSPASIASFASVVGLYGAIIILVIIWGKTIRGYEEPLLGYGLNLFSSEKVKDLIIGLITGFGLVGALYGLFVHFHFIDLRMTAVISISNSTLSILISHWNLLKLLVQALTIGISIAMVEEVLFRSWLIEEMTVDLGYWKAVFLSGFVFAVFHRSLSAIPGLWLLSIALSIARARFNGELAFPVGLHAGLITANFVLTVGGFVEYRPNVSNWLTGVQAGNPLAGLVGILMMGILIFTLYPWKFFRTFQRGNRNEGENIIR